MKEKIRSSNIELLRIISMVMIVASHYVDHGLETTEMIYSFNQYIAGILCIGAKLGVCVFVLISGYFMVESKFTILKLIKLIAEVYFYVIGIGVLFLFVLQPVESLGISSIIKMMNPIGYNYYWFMTDYILLMLASPALNLLIKNMSKEMHRNLLIGAIIVWSIFPNFTLATFEFNELGWFIVLYFIAAYIRKYVKMERENANRHLYVAMITFLLVVISDVILIYLGHISNVEIFTIRSTHFMSQNSPFTLFIAVELLIGFLNMKPCYNRHINMLASATLGVYLIHDNKIFRQYLWITLLKVPEMYASKYFFVHALVSILGVYLSCSCIDLIRQCTIERIFMSFIKKHLGQIKNKVSHIVNCGSQRITSILNWYYKQGDREGMECKKEE